MVQVQFLTSKLVQETTLLSDRLTFDASSADVNIAALGLNLASVADKISAQNSLGAIDQAIVSVSAY
jgi:flagellin